MAKVLVIQFEEVDASGDRVLREVQFPEVAFRQRVDSIAPAIRDHAIFDRSWRRPGAPASTGKPR